MHQPGPSPMSGGIEDLSDDELLARLVNRGVSDDLARHWVRHRDEPDVQHSILYVFAR